MVCTLCFQVLDSFPYLKNDEILGFADGDKKNLRDGQTVNSIISNVKIRRSIGKI